jgi:uncharacterized protein with ACT and thioredoxin-like domain
MSSPPDFSTRLAHNEVSIEHLGSRLTGVESGLGKLQSEVHTGFSAIQTAMAHQIAGLASKLDRLDAAPRFNFHETVKTVTTLAVLFSMVVAGILYVTSAQYAATMAEQKSLNAQRTVAIDDLNERVRTLEVWRPVITKKD